MFSEIPFTKAVISNGFRKFHLSNCAEQMSKQGDLRLLITGAYPRRWQLAGLKLVGLHRARGAKKFSSRRFAVPDHQVVSLLLPELVHYAGMFARVRRKYRLDQQLQIAALRWYGQRAVRPVRLAARNGAKIYHYRAGFGGQSVRAAREAGMVALCDYSIAHPDVLEFMVDNEGALPEQGDLGTRSPLWCYIKRDLEQADFVVVNSDFVRTTFEHAGIDTARVFVLYIGIDDEFVTAIESITVVPKAPDPHAPLRLILGGALSGRKGGHILAAAMRDLPRSSVTLDIIGSIEPGFDQASELLALDGVTYFGSLPRAELPMHFARREVFVFPSLAEGSAKVIFEAMACGLYIITTPNAGSIVRDGVHGALVPPGDAAALIKAISWANKNRERVREIGARNSELVLRNHRQSEYGRRLREIYASLDARGGHGG